VLRWRWLCEGGRRVIGLLLASGLLGCSQQGSTLGDIEGPRSAAIQPEVTPARPLAIPADLPRATARPSPKRRLLFMVTGLARIPDDLPERQAKLAGIEAGLVDALYRIVRERPNDFEFVTGEPTSAEFVVALGEGLTLRYRLAPDTPLELELVLDDRGRRTRLRVVDGCLTHAPYDSAAVSKVLARTGGAIKLLYSGWSDQPGHYRVQLGYYELATSGRGGRHHPFADAPSPPATSSESAP